MAKCQLETFLHKIQRNHYFIVEYYYIIQYTRMWYVTYILGYILIYYSNRGHRVSRLFDNNL